MFVSHVFVIYRTQYLAVFYFPFLLISLNCMGFLTIKIIKFFSDFLLLHICNDLSWVKCVFCHIFHKENNNCSRSQLVKILSPNYLRAVPI